MDFDLLNWHSDEASECEKVLKEGAIITVAEGGFRVRNLPLGSR
jgi:hypothetical protein